MLERTCLLSVEGIFVGQSAGLDIDSGIVGMTGLKISGSAPDCTGSVARDAHVMQTLKATAMAL
jgi:hypothetical protein